MSSSGFLNALQAMELSQMCVQAIWDRDSPLKQIPGFTTEIIKRCVDANVESVYDIMELEDDDRDKLLKMDGRQMRDVARFCNAYPSIELAHEVEDPDNLSADEPITLHINLEREVDEDDAATEAVVPAPFYPKRKIENWWLVVGDQETKQLLSIKKVTVQRRLKVKLDFTTSQGAHKLKLFFISDSYAGADQVRTTAALLHYGGSVELTIGHVQEYDFTVDVAEGADSDEDSNEDDE